MGLPARQPAVESRKQLAAIFLAGHPRNICCNGGLRLSQEIVTFVAFPIGVLACLQLPPSLTACYSQEAPAGRIGDRGCNFELGN